MKDVVPLTAGWTLRHESAALPARVPGCVHTDLLAAGVIPDPFLSRNEEDVAWVGRADWQYDTVLPPLPPCGAAHERTDLVFDGLDTAATVTLGGEVVGRTRNMHRGYRFDVSGPARDAISGAAGGDAVLGGAGDSDDSDDSGGADGGGIPLSVLFTSAYTEAEAVRAQVGERPNSYPEPFQYIRKMACSFGWDWGPTLVTAGIWKPVRVERWSTARLSDVRPLVTVDTGTGRVEARIQVERTASGTGRPLTAELRVTGGPFASASASVSASASADTASADAASASASADAAAPARASVTFDGTRATVTAEVPGAALWWPRGYGGQPLYDCEVVLRDESGAALDNWSRRIGFRTVALDTSADEHGTGFTLVVNGERIFARGVNWIPDDVFPSRITPERYRTRLTQATEAGVDLVRVWGGGIYESDAFYDICDELGLMVWQDFLFACAAYPEEQPLRSEVEAEARENVTRLMPHASLVLWNGNNENLWGFRDWQWEEELAGDSWGEGYYLGLLPRIVAETDPTRPYTAGSPWSGSWDHHPNDPAHGTSHSWEVWNRTDYTDYLDQSPRFAAEFGWQAPPAYATLRRALPGEQLAADSPGMVHHQKAAGGNGKLERGLARHFAVPADFDRWHYLTQVNQARAIATGIEHWRAQWPVCAGTVVWQLNDCWPVTSWSAIDGDGRYKPLFHELRRVYADRLLTVQTGDGGLRIAAVNQSARPWCTGLRVRRMTAGGKVLAEAVLELSAPARAVGHTAVPAALVPDAGTGTGAAEEFLVADADADADGDGAGLVGSGSGSGSGGVRAWHFPVRDMAFAYPAPEFDVEVVRREGGGRVDVVVTARTLLRDLLLQADRLAPAAVADRGLLTLLPGESATIGVRGWDAPDLSDPGLSDPDLSDPGLSDGGAEVRAVRAALFAVEPA
ncbi:glycoside hydrolase family 2 protein [Streptomyces sp. SID10853]|uniref:glycoside hydrolase family 2 protein n=1 Tax=Streptomyces sp. SID10853 TaxID=2706028 RepID=UPI0013C13CF9|nr:glycoside hydrolase family 2 protein [Streptomyces sp. SID10853]NDZ81864.1 glycoside hydrolase family 2 protein [Streptomyces sp. SID10853]